MSTILDALARKKKQTPQFEHMWRVVLPEINVKGMNDSTQAGEKNLFVKAKEFIFSEPDSSIEISHRVYSVELPYGTFETSKHTYGSSFFYTPGNFDVASCNIKVDEYEDGATLKYFTDWYRLMRNVDGTHNPPVTYKRDFTLIRMASSGSDLHITKYKGCFPSEIQPSSYSYDSSGVMQYNITLTGDSSETVILDRSKVRSLIGSNQNGIKADVDPSVFNKIKDWLF
jgi:hypothetical protein